MVVIDVVIIMCRIFGSRKINFAETNSIKYFTFYTPTYDMRKPLRHGARVGCSK